MRALVGLLLLFSMISHSAATYCLCRDGVSERQLQTTIDYACGAGADCKPILQTGSCFQPNTVKAHCDWAANSYFQRMSQTGGSCDFSAVATLSNNPPPNVAGGCVYPSSSSSTGTTTAIPNVTTASPGLLSETPGLGPTGLAEPNHGVSVSVKDTNFIVCLVFSAWFSCLFL